MTRNNLPILYRNVLDGLEPKTEHAAFLWAAESKDESRYKYKSEAYAREVGRLAMLPKLIEAAAVQYSPEKSLGDAGREDLMRFVLKRHANTFWGGNTKMWWEAP